MFLGFAKGPLYIRDGCKVECPRFINHEILGESSFTNGQELCTYLSIIKWLIRSAMVKSNLLEASPQEEALFINFIDFLKRFYV